MTHGLPPALPPDVPRPRAHVGELLAFVAGVGLSALLARGRAAWAELCADADAARGDADAHGDDGRGAGEVGAACAVERDGGRRGENGTARSAEAGEVGIGDGAAGTTPVDGDERLGFFLVRGGLRLVVRLPDDVRFVQSGGAA